MGIIDRSQSLYSWAMKLRQVGRVQIGRILGSVPNTHGGYKALIDVIERTYIMRAELNAVSKILIDKKMVTDGEWQKYLEEELKHLFTEVAKHWPEIEFGDSGYTIKNAAALAERAKREGWPP